MNQIDLGTILVALASIPSGPPQPAKQVQMRNVLDEADSALAGFNKPRSLPPQMAFLDAGVVTSPVQMIVATYGDLASGKSITLAQSPVSGLHAKDGERATVYTVGEDLDEIEVAGEKAARVSISKDPALPVARSGIVWLRGENVFQLSGRGTTEAELVEIAASV